MTGEAAKRLREAAEALAFHFSKPERKEMFTGENWEVEKIIALSDSTAAVIFRKEKGQKAAAFFYLKKDPGNGDKWACFFPSDSHILGMTSFPEFKAQVEKENLSRRYSEEKG